MRFFLALFLFTTPALSFELPFGCGDWSQCRPIEVREQDGAWQAISGGRFASIPQQSIVPIRSPDGRAYLCSTPQEPVRCFIRPFM